MRKYIFIFLNIVSAIGIIEGQEVFTEERNLHYLQYLEEPIYFKDLDEFNLHEFPFLEEKDIHSILEFLQNGDVQAWSMKAFLRKRGIYEALKPFLRWHKHQIRFRLTNFKNHDGIVNKSYFHIQQEKYKIIARHQFLDPRKQALSFLGTLYNDNFTITVGNVALESPLGLVTNSGYYRSEVFNPYNKNRIGLLREKLNVLRPNSKAIHLMYFKENTIFRIAYQRDTFYLKINPDSTYSFYSNPWYIPHNKKKSCTINSLAGYIQINYHQKIQFSLSLHHSFAESQEKQEETPYVYKDFQVPFNQFSLNGILTFHRKKELFISEYKWIKPSVVSFSLFYKNQIPFFRWSILIHRLPTAFYSLCSNPLLTRQGYRGNLFLYQIKNNLGAVKMNHLSWYIDSEFLIRKELNLISFQHYPCLYKKLALGLKLLAGRTEWILRYKNQIKDSLGAGKKINQIVQLKLSKKWKGGDQSQTDFGLLFPGSRNKKEISYYISQKFIFPHNQFLFLVQGIIYSISKKRGRIYFLYFSPVNPNHWLQFSGSGSKFLVRLMYPWKKWSIMIEMNLESKEQMKKEQLFLGLIYEK